MKFKRESDYDVSEHKVLMTSEQSDPLESSRDAFSVWLSTGKAKKYSTTAMISCIDRISIYAIDRKIILYDIWNIVNPSVFKSIYSKLLEEKLLRIMYRKTYKVFIVAGQQYLKFLKEKTVTSEASQSNDAIEPVHSIENFIAWLTTQPNANGKLYLEYVVRQYAGYLRSAPSRLDLKLPTEERDVFKCNTMKEFNTLCEIFRAAPNFKMVNSKTSGSFSAGLSCFSRYLEYLAGKIETNEASAPAVKLLSDTIQTSQANIVGKTTMLVDFNKPEQCAQIRPVYLFCTIDGQIVIPPKKNWSQLLVTIIEYFIKEGNPNLHELDSIPLYGKREFFMPQKAKIGTCAMLTNGKWVYTNYNPQTIITIIRNLICHCGVDLDNVSISYIPKHATNEQSSRYTMRENADPYSPAVPKSFVEPKVLITIMNVLSTHFPNGFKTDSPIELMRFRRFASDFFADEILLCDEELNKAIISCGFLYQGKVYVVEKKTQSRIRDVIDTEIANNAEVIYYASVYERHENWLFSESVVSEDMLRMVLKKFYPSYIHKPKYFLTKDKGGTETVLIKNEILRVWNHDVLLSYEQLSDRLPCIPLNKTKNALAQNNDFIWSSNGVYTHTSKIDISNVEQSDIKDYVANTCRNVGYASINDVPLGEIEEKNFQLTLTAIHNALFTLILADQFDKRGKIITRKGDMLDALTILKDDCRNLDKCSLQDLLDLQFEITGEKNRWVSMEAANAVMVRTNKETYVADKHVRFNVSQIDYILDQFVTGDYLPLKSITTFAAFPDCGHVWNLFLLESYCRRFSRRYRFALLSSNSRNTGVIVRNDCTITYIEIMADAVASEADLVLEKAAIEDFLCNAGYIGRRSYAKTDELIGLAKTIRERRK